MITLSLLQQLENEGFGTIDTDLFYEEAPLDSNGNPKEGVWIVSRGSAVTRFNTEIQSFDLYSRYKNKITGAKKLYDILDYLKEAYSSVCDLPACPPYSESTFKNVRILPTSGVENVGTDENGKVVRVISGEVYYVKENN